MIFTNGDATRGILGRKRSLMASFIDRQSLISRDRSKSKSGVPSRVMSYAKKMAEITGVDIKTTLKSTPVQNYWKTWNEQRTS